MSLATYWQIASPWKPAINSRLIELWQRPDLTVRQIADLLFSEFGHRWDERVVGWKARKLGMPSRSNGSPTEWTAEMEYILRTEWANGTRSRSIGDLLLQRTGAKFTKNAILGKAHRLGLDRHQGAHQIFNSVIEREFHRRERKRLADARHYARKKRKQPETAPTNIEDFAIPTPQRKTLLQLGSHDCRFGIGDPRSDQFFFCGAPVAEGRSYCPGHYRRCHIEPRRY